MKRRLPSAVVPAFVLALTLSLTSCGSDDAPTTASDPAAPGDVADPPQPPSAVPSAAGSVRSTGLPTVMDTGEGAELCLGAIAESYPPQCGGPSIPNWDWADQRGYFEQQGGVRWGTFAVTGTWDGSAFTVTDAITGALYDPIMTEPVELPEPTIDYGAEELQGIVESIGDEVSGYLGSSADDTGHVLVDVVYDDGTLQAYVDEVYGAGVVVLRSALADVE